jgi:general secretion pathway protein D
VSRAGVSLSVLPVIEADGFVDLAISPRISDLTGWTPNGMPIVFDRSMRTDVRVKDGETYVLGGLKRTELVDSVQGVPILKSLPLLGWFFSKRTRIKLERDVIVIIRPRILGDGDHPSMVDDKVLPDVQPKAGDAPTKP